MEQLGQIPLGVALSLRVLAAGALQDGEEQRMANFSQSCGVELGLDGGAVGLVYLPGQDFKFLNGRVHIESLPSIINLLIINVLIILARTKQMSRGAGTVYNLFTERWEGTGVCLSLFKESGQFLLGKTAAMAPARELMGMV